MCSPSPSRSGQGRRSWLDSPGDAPSVPRAPTVPVLMTDSKIVTVPTMRIAPPCRREASRLRAEDLGEPAPPIAAYAKLLGALPVNGGPVTVQRLATL